MIWVIMVIPAAMWFWTAHKARGYNAASRERWKDFEEKWGPHDHKPLNLNWKATAALGFLFLAMAIVFPLIDLMS